MIKLHYTVISKSQITEISLVICCIFARFVLADYQTVCFRVAECGSSRCGDVEIRQDQFQRRTVMWYQLLREEARHATVASPVFPACNLQATVSLQCSPILEQAWVTMCESLQLCCIFSRSYWDFFPAANWVDQCWELGALLRMVEVKTIGTGTTRMVSTYHPFDFRRFVAVGSIDHARSKLKFLCIFFLD